MEETMSELRVPITFRCKCAEPLRVPTAGEALEVAGTVCHSCLEIRWLDRRLLKEELERMGGPLSSFEELVLFGPGMGKVN